MYHYTPAQIALMVALAIAGVIIIGILLGGCQIEVPLRPEQTKESDRDRA